MNRFMAKLRAVSQNQPCEPRTDSQNQQRPALRQPLADKVNSYKTSLRKSRPTLAALLVAASALQVGSAATGGDASKLIHEQNGESHRPQPPFAANDAAAPKQSTQLPSEVRSWYRNPDGSCVQCSIGMCGVWSNVPAASTLLWNTEYGPAERRGAWPSRVSEYAASRGIKLYNVTGETTFDWLRWAARTGRFAAMAAGSAHFQTLYGIDPSRSAWQVCNNNSPTVIDDYSEAEFRRLHARGGAWVVVLDTPAVPATPVYEK